MPEPHAERVPYMFKRRYAIATSLGAMLLAAGAGASAQDLNYRSQQAAPPSWQQFAKLVKYRFEEWISADDEVAKRFRGWVLEHAGKDDGPPQKLIIRVWANPDGTIEKVTFPALTDPQANDDLRAILKRGNIGEAPPPEMLQPLQLGFTFPHK
jgi:hypothetical protein